jgi:hypothetical protein
MPKPFTEYERLIARAGEITTRNVARATDQAENANNAHSTFVQTLTRATHEYLDTGIAKYPDHEGYVGWVRWGDRSHFNFFSYFKQLAKEHSRPFVWVTHNSTTIRIERRKYTEPLVASFLLDGYRLGVGSSRPPHECPITYWANPTYWQVNLHDETATARMEMWLNMCRTEPLMRRALRLPR